MDTDLPDTWKPNRCKFVLTIQQDHNKLMNRPQDRLQVSVDASYPNAWRKEPYHSTFLQMAKNGIRVVIFVGDRCICLLPSGKEHETKRIPFQEIGATTTQEVIEWMNKKRSAA
jgi:hypothetical protein